MDGDGRKQISRRLRQLYKKIPSVSCVPGCSDCCGPVPFSKEEIDLIGPDTPIKEDEKLRCPFSTDYGCEIYEKRPFMCRLFGTSVDPKLVCPRGQKSVNPLSIKEARRLSYEYHDMIRYERKAERDKRAAHIQQMLILFSMTVDDFAERDYCRFIEKYETASRFRPGTAID